MKLETFQYTQHVITAAMENFHVESIARGVYKDIWMPNHGDIFDIRIEEQNIHDRYIVAIVIDTDVVGHCAELDKIGDK